MNGISPMNKLHPNLFRNFLSSIVAIFVVIVNASLVYFKENDL